MKKNGFIATSLIYSFFLVFIAIIATLLNNYIANKTILDRYNENAQENLNNDTFSVRFLVSGAEVGSSNNYSLRLTNLLFDAELSTIGTADSPWTKVGTFQTSFFSSTPKYLNVSSASANSYISTNIPTSENHKYYMGIKNRQIVDTPVEVSFITGCSISTTKTDSNWRYYSNICVPEVVDPAAKFIIGKSTYNYTNIAFREAMLLDLTASYGTGNEPNIEWLDENLEFFTGTMNYLVEQDIERGSSLKVSIIGGERLSINPTISCIGKNSNWVSNNATLKHDISTGKSESSLELKEISDDIVCTVRWQNG